MRGIFLLGLYDEVLLIRHTNSFNWGCVCDGNSVVPGCPSFVDILSILLCLLIYYYRNKDTEIPAGKCVVLRCVCVWKC